MPLSFVHDEHLRAPLWHGIQRHNIDSEFPLDAIRVGDPSDLPLGSDDPSILLWAEQKGRILVTEDRHTMPGHMADYLAAGNHSPGVFVVRSSIRHSELLHCLELVAYAGDGLEYRDAVTYIP